MSLIGGTEYLGCSILNHHQQKDASLRFSSGNSKQFLFTNYLLEIPFNNILLLKLGLLN
jgi:hypothetical protein